MIYVLLALQLADAITTVLFIQKGGYERNPFIAWVMERIGVIPALMAVKIPLCAVLVWANKYPEVQWVFAGAIALYVWVVWNNIKVIRRLSRG